MVSIGGVTVDEIFATIETYFFFENKVDRQFVLTHMPRSKAFLKRAGMKSNFAVIKIRDDYSSWEVEVDWLSERELMHRPSHIFLYEKMDGIMYIDIRQMVIEQPEFDNLLWAIRDEIRGGTRYFIVDLRYNGGGNSLVNQRIFGAMGITEPTKGLYFRISPLSVEQAFINVRSFSENLQAMPTTETAENRNNVTIAVLTNAQTYSSARLFAQSVQDGGFGVVVGEASRNAPSAFGNMLQFTLPQTQINLNVSSSRLLRPDINANQLMIAPDIKASSDNALEAALNYFNGR